MLDLAGYPVFPGGFGTWWPLILILIGVVQIVSWPWGWTGGVFLIVLGTIFQLSELGKLPGNFWAYAGAAAILFVGISILTRPWRQRRWRSPNRSDDERFGGAATDRPYGAPIRRWKERWGGRSGRWQQWQAPPRYHSNGEEAVFSNLTRTFDGEFTGAELKSVFGSLRIDMTRATLAPTGARLVLSAVFGSVDVRVPKDWRVDVHGAPTGGRIQNDAASGSGPTLTVECESVFGNVEIRK